MIQQLEKSRNSITVHKKIFSWAALISLGLSLISCANQWAGTSPIPDSGPTISQIYNSHITVSNIQQQTNRPLPDGDTSLSGYTRQVFNELSVVFPRLPNPTIVMYIFPHLSKERAPIPGYSTMFQLYERVEYALPGEI